MNKSKDKQKAAQIKYLANNNQEVKQIIEYSYEGKKYRLQYSKDYREQPLYRKIVIRAGSLQYKFGITIDDYNAMFEKQQGRCAVCHKHQSELKRTLDVDHNHITGQIRGLLCSSCNTAIGALEADYGIGVLRNAIAYIEKGEITNVVK